MNSKKDIKLLTQLLNLEEVKVISHRQYEGVGIILQVEGTRLEAICPRCGKKSHKLHQNHPHIVKDLPWGEQLVFLEINRRQFKCQHCQKPFSEDLNFIQSRRTYTKRLARQIIQQVIESDVHSVAQKRVVTTAEIERMLKDASGKCLNGKPVGLKKLGIDEIALLKGQGNYCAVFVDLEKAELITIVQGRNREALAKVLNSWGAEVLEAIEEVSIDLWKGYKNLVKELMPNAQVVADRFHVMAQINQELDEGRKAEKRQVEEAVKASKSSQEKEKHEQVLAQLKKSKYVLLKNEENLNSQQIEKLKQVKAVSSKLKIMQELKEEIRKIFEETSSGLEGLLKLGTWLSKAQKYFSKSPKTIIRWLDEILAYFDNRTTSGVVEGINNKLKLIKRSGYGFRNFNNFQARCWLNWHFN